MSASTERRKRNEKAFRTLRRKQAKISGRKPVRDPQYLAYIRSHACILCDDAIERRVFVDGKPYRQETRTEAAHVGEIRGIGQKCADNLTIPLCARHHRTGKDSHHVMGKRFWAHHGINLKAVVEGLMQRYFGEAT
jgi:hypothetical protein